VSRELDNEGNEVPDLSKIIDLYSQLPAGVEIAIGGGNPLAHAGFDEFVEELSNQGKICNVTVNEFHFADERKRLERLISNGHLKGVVILTLRLRLFGIMNMRSIMLLLG
jgi:organic radical activating enzyme